MTNTATALLLSFIVVSASGGDLLVRTLRGHRPIEAAEQEGAAFPHGIAKAPPPIFGGRTIGTAKRKCVEFPRTQLFVSRRSGEFETGAMIAGLKAVEGGKVWWTPLHDPERTKATLLVRGIRLDQPSIASNFASSNYAWPIGRDGHVMWGASFYPSWFSLPSAGRWLLIATSGSDWGCFIVKVSKQ